MYETFEAFLEELGIRLVIDAEEDSARDLDYSEAGLVKAAISPKNPSVSRGRSRRASFSSVREVEEDDTRISRARGDSRSSVSRLQIRTRAIPDDRPSTRATTRPTERTQSRIKNPISNVPRSDRGRLSAAQFGSNLQHQRRRRASASSHGSQQTGHPNPLPNESAISNQNDAVSTHGSSNDMHRGNVHAVYQGAPATYLPAPSELLYRPSITQLLRDADTFRNYHIQSLARETIGIWRAAALRLQDDHQKRRKLAIARDRDVLLRQGFDQWRVAFLTRRQAAETERFFSHLERRAGRARDLYLLSKAFTHWAQCTSEEVERTSLARRHILRTRYFNAWRDITAVNDLKVRRQGLRKFFPLWQHRYRITLAAKNRAVIVYQGDLVKSIYWRWFWSFCERRAPVWRDARLKKQLFLQWSYRAHVIGQHGELVTLSKSEQLRRHYFSDWLGKTRKALSHNAQAEQFRRQNLLNRHWLIWRLQFQYQPLVRRVSSMIDWRVAYTTFSVLLDRHALENHARTVNRLRLLRDVWTQWNDRLRWQTLAHQIDDRCAVQALYKWVLAERYLLLRRLYEKRLKQRIFVKIAQFRRRLNRRNSRSCQTVVVAHNRQSLITIIRRWVWLIEIQRQRERLALEYHSPRILQDVLMSWRASCSHVQKLEKWTKDVIFYFRAGRALRSWQTALAESQKRKRRDAYTGVRRLIKMNLASRVIGKWHELTTQALALKQTAEDANRQRLFKFATATFDRWHNTSTFLLDRNHQVAIQYMENLTHNSLQTWLSRHRFYQQASAEASDYYGLHTSKAAYESLRALQIKVFELRSRNETAASFKHWNEKRRFRNVLRLWREATARRRGQPSPVDLSRTARSRRFGARLFNDGGGAIAHHEDDWTAFDVDEGPPQLDNSMIPALEPQTNITTTPLFPGTFGTPSKRAARARALVSMPMTPATPLLGKVASSSFQRRLRLPVTESRYSRRTELGHSIGAGGGGGGGNVFEDIAEVSSSNTPGTR